MTTKAPSKSKRSIASSLRETLTNETIPAKDRASIASFEVIEHGIDTLGPLTELITEADAGRTNQTDEQAVCVSECLIHKGGDYALVTLDNKDARVAADAKLLNKLDIGDRVWIDTELKRIVGRDGELPTRGDIAVIESKPADHPRQVIVKYHERLEVARLPQWMIDDPKACKSGDEVVYDPRTRFIERPISSRAEPSDLAAELDSLKKVAEEDLGALKPELKELLERIECMIHHPEWFQRLRSEPRLGYLLCGPTGTGKSFSAAYVVTQFHQMIAALVGRPISRTVVVNASEFWSPWFGETEQKIIRWFYQLQQFASQPIRSEDGREIYPPVIVLLEECEALFRSRSANDSSSHLFDRPLSLLLAKLDSSEDTLRAPIIWLCTSNRPDLTDSAALRRIGSRQLNFGHLKLAETIAILKKSISPDLPLASTHDDLLQTVVGYLYGQSPPQGLVELQMSNSQHRTIDRRDLVTPAVLNEALSWAKDRALRRSVHVGSLQAIDAGDVVLYLRRHFRTLCQNLQPHNVAEHVPQLVAGQSLHVTGVVSLQHNQRPMLPRMN